MMLIIENYNYISFNMKHMERNTLPVTAITIICANFAVQQNSPLQVYDDCNSPKHTELRKCLCILLLLSLILKVSGIRIN